MTTRDELHDWIDRVPEHDLDLVADELRRRVRPAPGPEDDDEPYYPGGIPFSEEEMADAERQRLEAFTRMKEYAEQNRAAYAAMLAGAFPAEDERGAGVS